MYIHEFFIPLIVAILAGLVILLLAKLKPSLKSSWIFWSVAILLVVLSVGAVHFLLPQHVEKPDLVIAGNVFDESGALIQGANISLSGRSELTVSGSSGNFRLVLDPVVPAPDFVTLHVEKYGYNPYNNEVKPGQHGLPVQLSKVTK
jgi:hypothetical protein